MRPCDLYHGHVAARTQTLAGDAVVHVVAERAADAITVTNPKLVRQAQATSESGKVALTGLTGDQLVQFDIVWLASGATYGDAYREITGIAGAPVRMTLFVAAAWQ